MICLQVIGGPENGLTVDDRETNLITLGRAVTNTLSLNDPRISRRHAQIERRTHGGLYAIRDLRSTGGTVVRREGEDHPVGPSRGGIVLALGDLIILAESESVIRVDALTPVTPGPQDAQTTLATIAASDLPKAEERISRDVEQLRSIVDFDRVIGGTMEESQVLKEAVVRLAELYPPSLYVSALRLGDDGSVMKLQAAGRFKEHARTSLTVSRLAEERSGIRYEVARDVLMLAAKEESTKAEALSQASRVPLGDISGICVPVIYSERPRYFLMAEAPKRVFEFSDADLDLMMILANRAAARIENLRALEHLAKQGRMACAGMVSLCIAHDLGNIASLMTASVGLLGDKLVEFLPEDEKQRRLTSLSYATRQLKARCYDFLSLGKTSSDEAFDLLVVARRIGEEFTEILKPRANVRIESDDPLCRIPGDESRIERLFWNLFDNAYKVVRQEKDFVLEIRVEIETQDCSVEIRVSDNIPGGMPEADLRSFADLRDELFQVDSDELQVLEALVKRMDEASVRRKQGYGIGSFFMCMTVRDMGGSLEVKTCPDGTCFVIVFPKDS